MLVDTREDIKDLVILVNRIEDEPRSANVRAVSTSIGSLLATDAPKNLFWASTRPKPAQVGLTRLRRLCITEAPIVNVDIGA